MANGVFCHSSGVDKRYSCDIEAVNPHGLVKNKLQETRVSTECEIHQLWLSGVWREDGSYKSLILVYWLNWVLEGISCSQHVHREEGCVHCSGQPVAILDCI